MSLYSFGECEFDGRTGGLLRRGCRRRLRPQAAAVLSYLLERPGRLVTRHELHLVLWPEGTFVGFEDGLNACIKQIRAALSDERVQPRYLETLPRRGYRFIAPVRTRGEHESVPAASWPRVVILPFQCVRTEDVSLALADGLTQEIITRLTLMRPPRMSVVAKPFGFGLSARGQMPAGVDFALAGSIRVDDRRFRIAVQLIDLSDHTHLWAAAFDGALDRALASHVRIAKQVIAGVIQTLHGERPRKLRAPMTA